MNIVSTWFFFWRYRNRTITVYPNWYTYGPYKHDFSTTIMLYLNNNRRDGGWAILVNQINPVGVELLFHNRNAQLSGSQVVIQSQWYWSQCSHYHGNNLCPRAPHFENAVVGILSSCKLPVMRSGQLVCDVIKYGVKIWPFDPFLCRFLRNKTVLFSVQGWTIYIVEEISNQSKVGSCCWKYGGKMSAKIQCVATKCGIFVTSIVALNENGELQMKLSFFVITLHKKTNNWTFAYFIVT